MGQAAVNPASIPEDLQLSCMIDLSTLASFNHGPLLDHIRRVWVVQYRSEEAGL
jgi:hypothetical protein